MNIKWVQRINTFVLFCAVYISAHSGAAHADALGPLNILSASVDRTNRSQIIFRADRAVNAGAVLWIHRAKISHGGLPDAKMAKILANTWSTRAVGDGTFEHTVNLGQAAFETGVTLSGLETAFKLEALQVSVDYQIVGAYKSERVVVVRTLQDEQPVISDLGPGCTALDCIWLKGTKMPATSEIQVRRNAAGAALLSTYAPGQYSRTVLPDGKIQLSLQFKTTAEKTYFGTEGVRVYVRDTATDAYSLVRVVHKTSTVLAPTVDSIKLWNCAGQYCGVEVRGQNWTSETYVEIGRKGTSVARNFAAVTPSSAASNTTEVLDTANGVMRVSYWSGSAQYAQLHDYGVRVTVIDPSTARASVSKSLNAATTPGTPSVQLIPNDPLFVNQWEHLSGNGESLDAGSAVAWTKRTDCSSVPIAILDTGVDLGHPDLMANLAINSGEIAGNGIDDDSNGYTDDVYGVNTGNHSNLIQDTHYHGTVVAGVAAAVGNNGIGIAGMCHRAKIIVVKVSTESGLFYSNYIASGMAYARSRGAKIINISAGGYQQMSDVEQAITAARGAGVLVVASAGNENNNNDTNRQYPSSYTQDNIIAAAAAGSAGGLASFSNFGLNSVDLAAPGVALAVTTPRVTTASMTANGVPVSYSAGQLGGTSVAAPLIAGAAALLWSEHPTWTYQQVRARLFETVRPLAPSSPAKPVAMGGRLAVDLALEAP